MNSVLAKVYDSCFHSDSGVAAEARLLAKSIIERQFIAGDDDFRQMLANELKPNKISKTFLNDLDPSVLTFENSEVEEFVLTFVDKFEHDPRTSNFVPKVLKQAFQVNGVEKRMAVMFKKICLHDESAADHILSIIWDAKIRSTLEADLKECALLTKNERWKAIVLDVLRSIGKDRHSGEL